MATGQYFETCDSTESGGTSLQTGAEPQQRLCWAVAQGNGTSHTRLWFDSHQLFFSFFTKNLNRRLIFHWKWHDSFLPTIAFFSLAQWKKISWLRPCLQKCNSGCVTEDTVERGATGGFDCNICLDFVHDPVVTFCGHLYCWPCIYKWIHYQSVSAEKQDCQQPECPVCKAVISKERLVPLYGRGRSTKPSEAKALQLGLVIPERPSSPRCGSHTHITTPSMQPTQQLHHPMPGSYSAIPMLSLNNSRTSTTPMVGVLGEMVYARLFGISETTLYNTNSYSLITNSNPRLRRHVMEADKSLGRLLFFLCCCMLCLLLF